MPSNQLKSLKFKVKSGVIALFLLFTFYLSFLPFPVFAQEQNSNKSVEQLLNSILNTVGGCMILGISFSPQEPCKDNPTNSVELSSKSSAMGFVSQGISLAFTPPLSTQEYLADVGANLGFIKPAHAQITSNVSGSGNNIILPVKRLWSIMRNFSYLAFTFVFVFVGMMIMFRRKLNPQTVISIQSALPGLITGLALVTFSYLIAAALIDLAFVLIPIVAGIFTMAGDNLLTHTSDFWKGTALANYTNLTEFAQNVNFFSFWWALLQYPDVFKAVFPSVESFRVPNPPPSGVSEILPWMTAWMSNLFKNLLDLLVASIASLGNLLIGFILAVMILFQMGKLFILLVRAYIAILVYTFLGPLMILMGSIPGKGAMIGTWWKQILANSLIFPAVFAGFFFGGLILSDKGINETSFSATLPFFSGLPVQLFKYIIGYAIILGTPSIPAMVKEMVGVKDSKGIFEEGVGAFTQGFKPIRAGTNKGLGQITKDYQVTKEADLKYKIATREEEIKSRGGALHPGRTPWTHRLGAGLSALGIKS